MIKSLQMDEKMKKKKENQNGITILWLLVWWQYIYITLNSINVLFSFFCWFCFSIIPYSLNTYVASNIFTAPCKCHKIYSFPSVNNKCFFFVAEIKFRKSITICIIEKKNDVLYSNQILNVFSLFRFLYNEINWKRTWNRGIIMRYTFYVLLFFL